MTSITIGPLTFHMYGFCIMLGLIIFMYAIKKSPQFYLTGLQNHFDTMLCISIISGITGGRILYYLTHINEMDNISTVISVWNGGLSILGAITGIIVSLFLYMRFYQLPLLSILDLLSLYAPLIHMTGRIGCFIAGCCHGSLWNGPWSVIYQNQESLALLNCPLHPAQLYSAFSFLCMFIFFYSQRNTLLKNNGTLFSLYLLLSGIERVCNEFFRYEYQISNDTLSTYQIIGILFCIFGFALLIKIFLQKQCIFSATKQLQK